MLEIFHFYDDSVGHLRMIHEPAVEVAVRIVPSLARLGQLCQKKLPVPVPQQRIAL
jgi:hypothetical protein